MGSAEGGNMMDAAIVGRVCGVVDKYESSLSALNSFVCSMLHQNPSDF